MNTTTTTNQSLFDVIDNLDNTPRIAALRGIVHSTMAKCIGAIRQDMRNRARNERDEESPQIDLDQRNMFDENHRIGSSTDDIHDGYNLNEPTDAGDEAKRYMGFSTEMPPLKQASLFHAVYDWASADLRTLAASKWDEPLSIEQMLEFMTKSAPKLDPVLAKALADAAKTNVKTIERMHELQAQREMEQLIEATPEILMTFEGFGRNGYEESINDLPKVMHHQLGVKVVESLNKARDQVLSRVLRTRRIADLASVPIIEDAAKQVSSWVEQFERRHSDEINEAIDAGRNIRTLEDVATL